MMDIKSAEQKLLDGYTMATGKKPNATVALLCNMSAARVAAGDGWKWVIEDRNKNFRERLEFSSTEPISCPAGAS